MRTFCTVCTLVIALLIACPVRAADKKENVGETGRVPRFKVIDGVPIPSIDSITRVDRKTHPSRSEMQTMAFILRTKPHPILGQAYVIVTDHDEEAYLKPLRRLAEYHAGVLVRVENLATLYAAKTDRERLIEKLRNIKPRFVAIAPRLKSFRENMLLGMWDVLLSLSPDRQLNVFPGLLVAPNEKAFAALIDRSIRYRPPRPDAVRPLVIGQVVDSSPLGQRSLQKVGICRNLFDQCGCDSASLVVRTYQARLPEGTQAGKEDNLRQWEVSAAAPRQFITDLPPAAKGALDEASLLLLFGHGAPGMTCSLDMGVFRNVKMVDKVVLCGSCFSAFPPESDFPPVACGSDGSAFHADRERFVMRAIENGAVVAVGHMRENSGFPHIYPLLEAWMEGLSVGEAYQRLINAIIDIRGLSAGELALREGAAGSQAAVARRNFLLYVVVGDPALRPLPRMSARQAVKKPNFIVILVDDLGYRDVGVYGAKDIPTPHIDSLARNGTRFSDGYSACPVCTPARAALLTGRYQQRYGLEWVLSPDRKSGKTQFGLDVREKTLADLLREQGYATGALGKWHLGDQPQYLPTRRGFDYFYGYLQWGHYYLNPSPEELANPSDPWFLSAKSQGGLDAARYMSDVSNSPIYRNERVAGYEGYLTDVLNREAVEFIERNKERPFFLYLAHAGQHMPLQATEKYLRRFPKLSDEKQRRVYAAALSAIDDGVGEILAKLREDGLEKDTAIFFTSDNGGPSYWKPRPEILDIVKSRTPPGAAKEAKTPDYRVVSERFQRGIGGNGSDNLPLSFGKGILYEGGVRVPLIVQWPGVAAPDTVSAAVVSHLDILPTCVAAAGGKLPADREYDGADLRGYFSGMAGAWTDRPMFWRVWRDRAVRMGKWKLVWDGDAAPRLYDLAVDIEEEKDLAAQQPEIVGEKQAAWQAWDKKNIAPLFQYGVKAASAKGGD